MSIIWAILHQRRYDIDEKVGEEYQINASIGIKKIRLKILCTYFHRANERKKTEFTQQLVNLSFDVFWASVPHSLFSVLPLKKALRHVIYRFCMNKVNELINWGRNTSCLKLIKTYTFGGYNFF